MNTEQIPGGRGSDVLVLELSRSHRLKVGKLGEVNLPAGVYAYAGSAVGSGGLRARLGRHLRGDGARHWHIDYLRAVAQVRDCFYTVSDRHLECVWSQLLAALPGATIPIVGFGSSDCQSSCSSHLIAFPREVAPDTLQSALRSKSGLRNFSTLNSPLLRNPIQ